MRSIKLPQTRVALSVLCLGNAAFGTGISLDHQDQIYTAFRSAGGTSFDTAHCYCFWLPGGAGSSERELGECICRHGDVGKVQILTKGGHPDGGARYPRPDAYLAPEVISSDIADSLERLKMDSIDVYFLHRDDRRVPVGEIVDCMNEHLRAGQLRAMGASNWSILRLQEANDYAAAHRLAGFVASQPQFNLAQPNAKPPTTDPAGRYLGDDDIAWHESSQLPVVCYSPTAGGYFASGGVRGRGGYDNPISRGRMARATELGKQIGATVNQIAIAYLLHQRFPVAPILGTADLEHLKEAMGAMEIALSDEQVAWLRVGVGGEPGQTGR
jgi:aryl-alcohol dehydrogenase-like predicted oxidoreductase